MTTKKQRDNNDQSGNMAVIAGRVRTEPVLRSLPNDEVLLTFDLVSGNAPSVRTVPVSWQGAPRAAPKIDTDDSVVVLGTVQRRFFRAGGVTAHAVDVRAEIVARTAAARRRLVAKALERLEPI